MTQMTRTEAKDKGGLTRIKGMKGMLAIDTLAIIAVLVIKIHSLGS